LLRYLGAEKMHTPVPDCLAYLHHRDTGQSGSTQGNDAIILIVLLVAGFRALYSKTALRLAATVLIALIYAG
jgi:hypothetical protein